MKAISIRQPWADLILQGRKTLELRTWKVNHRGILAIHASQTVEREACLAFGMDPDHVAAGALIGTVELTGVVELSAADYEARKGEHLAAGWFGYKQPLYGWEVADPRPFTEPEPMRGHMQLFNVSGVPTPAEAAPSAPLSATAAPETSKERQPAKADVPPESFEPTSHHLADTMPFQLRVTAGGRQPGSYSLALYQRPVSTNGTTAMNYVPAKSGMRRVAELSGDLLRAVADHVLEALRRSGYRATDLHANRREPFHLGEEAGVRLGLLFLAVKPVTKSSRIEAISQGLRKMTSEEAYYWYSKCMAAPDATLNGERAHERAQKALRVLLADE
jgi:hypothetical protein